MAAKTRGGEERVRGCASRPSRAARALAAGDAAEATRLELADAVTDAVESGAALPPALAHWIGVSEERLAVFARAASAPALLRKPPAAAVETVLGLVAAFAPTRAVSLWLADERAGLRCAAQVGRGGAGARGRAAALDALAGAGPQDAGLSAVAVPRFGRPAGALVLRLPLGDRVAEAIAAEAAEALELVLERDLVMERAAERERTIAGSLEKRLTRVAFDLHDGPLQELAALGLELALVRCQIGGVVADDDRTRVEGRFDDLSARLQVLDAELRELVQSLKGLSRGGEPLALRLEREVDAFRAAGGIDARIELAGDLTELSDSQQIVVLRVVQEALANVREHSGARSVEVRVRELEGRVDAAVVDDGAGFDIGAAVADAGRRRRFGLAGMRERVRLLGGELRIDSAPGYGTSVAFVLRPWRSLVPKGSDAPKAVV